MDHLALIIAAAFIGVLAAGSVKIPRPVVRAFSFISFLLLFESIIIIADHKFHTLTGGEPWQMVIIKVVFIGVLSQLHHWLEHKLGHYLSAHRPFPEWRRQLTSWWKKDKAHVTTTAPHIHPPVEPTESTDEIL